MPTKNQRIAAYLPNHLSDRFQAFKADRAIKGGSQALIVILSEFFGVSQEVTHQSGSVNPELQERVEGLEEKIAQIKDELLSELRRELLESRSISIEQAKTEIKNELLSELKSESLKIETVSGQLELISQPIKAESIKEISTAPGLSGADLAKLIKAGNSTISEWKGKGILLEKTRAMNNGIGWIYDSETKKYFPENSVFSESPEAQKSELPGTIEPEF